MRTTPLVLASLSLLSLSACVADRTNEGVVESMEKRIEQTQEGLENLDDRVRKLEDRMAIHEKENSVMIGWKVDLTRTDGEDLDSYFDVAFVVTAEGQTQTVALGNYMGCGFEEIPEDGPLLVLRCWWAGSGDEFQVRMEGTNTLVVDYREVGEGMEGVPEFKPFKSMTIPEGLPIVPVPGEGVMRS